MQTKPKVEKMDYFSLGAMVRIHNDMYDGNPRVGDSGVLQSRGGGVLGDLCCNFIFLMRSSDYFNIRFFNDTFAITYIATP